MEGLKVKIKQIQSVEESSSAMNKIGNGCLLLIVIPFILCFVFMAWVFVRLSRNRCSFV